MKKVKIGWAAGIALLLAGLFCLSACAKNTGKDIAVEGAQLLQEAMAASTANKLLENMEYAAYRNTFYLEDGTEDTYLAYQDAERFVWCHETGTGVEIDENGDVYGFDEYAGRYYRYLFLKDAYEPIADTAVLWFLYDPAETPVSIERKDGVVSVTVRGQEESLRQLEETIGFTAREGDILNYVVHIEESTKLFLGCTTVLVSKDQTEKVIQETARVTDCGKYEVPAELKAVIRGDDMRTITVIENPGTSEETTYTQTVKRGCTVTVQSGNPDAVYYLDEACTQLLGSQPADYDADMTIYVK